MKRFKVFLKEKIKDNHIYRLLLTYFSKKYLREEFLNSLRYDDVIKKYYDYKIDGINSAEYKTKNYRYRHFKKRYHLGAWRWLGVYENKERLLKIFFSNKIGIDFGGARGPISRKIAICDRLSNDIYGRKVKFKDIKDIKDNSLDYIWSSHTLEHLDKLGEIVAQFYIKLKKRGLLLLHLPAYTCERWRAGIHSFEDEKGGSSHGYTFYLSGKSNNKRINKEYIAIDKIILKQDFYIEEAKYVGDNSILIVAKK